MQLLTHHPVLLNLTSALSFIAQLPQLHSHLAQSFPSWPSAGNHEPGSFPSKSVALFLSLHILALNYLACRGLSQTCESSGFPHLHCCSTCLYVGQNLKMWSRRQSRYWPRQTLVRVSTAAPTPGPSCGFHLFPLEETLRASWVQRPTVQGESCPSGTS